MWYWWPHARASGLVRVVVVPAAARVARGGRRGAVVDPCVPVAVPGPDTAGDSDEAHDVDDHV